MICPQCGGEYREGFTVCADCETPLVDGELAEPKPEDLPEVELVTVLESGNPSLVAIAESLLREADIQYVKSGEGLQDLFGWGRLGGLGYNQVVGPIRIQVAEKDAEVAAELLSDLSEEATLSQEEWESDAE